MGNIKTRLNRLERHAACEGTPTYNVMWPGDNPDYEALGRAGTLCLFWEEQSSDRAAWLRGRRAR